MEKEIYWSKDAEGWDCGANADAFRSKAPKNVAYGPSQPNKQVDNSNSSNWRNASNSRMRTSSPVIESSANAAKGGHLNNLASVPLLAKSKPASNLGDPSLKTPTASTKHAVKIVPKKESHDLKLNDLTNGDGGNQSGASFKSLRNEDKLKLASLIQELATLTEEHNLLKSSLEERVQAQQMERAAFEQETRKLYQEREYLSQTKLELEQKLHETLDELESIRSRETSRASVCLQTTPTKDKRQTNAPMMNSSLCSENSQGSQKSKPSVDPESQISSKKEKEANLSNDIAVPPSQAEPENKYESVLVARPSHCPSDAGLQNVEVLSKTEDCYSHCGSMFVGEMNQLSTIEKETLALKKKITEQEKLLELKRKQIDLQHQLHNQEIDAYNLSKNASEENVKNWIENLPNAVQGMNMDENKELFAEKPNNQGLKVTFSDCKNLKEQDEGTPIKTSKGAVKQNIGNLQKPDSFDKHRTVNGKFEVPEKGPIYASSSSDEDSERILRLRQQTRKLLRESEMTSSSPPNESKTRIRGRAVTAKVDSHYKPVRRELELKPNETTDDLLLEAAGKLMHCRRMMDRSENAINHYQYSKYMEALERKKLNEKLPVDDEFQRNMRRNAANDNGRRLMQSSGVQQSEKATEFIPSFVKLIDYMDDKVETPSKYSSAAADNVVNFALGYSPEDLFGTRSRRRQVKASRMRSSSSSGRQNATEFKPHSQRKSSRSRELPGNRLQPGFTRSHYENIGRPSSARSRNSHKTRNAIKSSKNTGSHKHNLSALTSELDSDETELFDDVFFVH